MFDCFCVYKWGTNLRFLSKFLLSLGTFTSNVYQQPTFRMRWIISRTLIFNFRRLINWFLSSKCWTYSPRCSPKICLSRELLEKCTLWIYKTSVEDVLDIVDWEHLQKCATKIFIEEFVTLCVFCTTLFFIRVSIFMT